LRFRFGYLHLLITHKYFLVSFATSRCRRSLGCQRLRVRRILPYHLWGDAGSLFGGSTLSLRRRRRN